jgi:hypothetical protein
MAANPGGRTSAVLAATMRSKRHVLYEEGTEAPSRARAQFIRHEKV